MSQLLFNLLPALRGRIETIAPDASIQECINRMISQDIGALVVMEGEELIGIVSERDIIRHCCQQDRDFCHIKAGEIAYKQVTILNERDTVEKAMQVVIATKRRHILLCEGKKLVAIISIGDLLYYLLAEDGRVIEHLEKYIAGTPGS